MEFSRTAMLMGAGLSFEPLSSLFQRPAPTRITQLNLVATLWTVCIWFSFPTFNEKWEEEEKRKEKKRKGQKKEKEKEKEIVKLCGARLRDNPGRCYSRVGGIVGALLKNLQYAKDFRNTCKLARDIYVTEKIRDWLVELRPGRCVVVDAPSGGICPSKLTWLVAIIVNGFEWGGT